MAFAMPMYHVFGYSECLLAVLFAGGAIIPRLVFDAEDMLGAAERHQASELVGVPMMTAKLVELARTRGFDSTHLKVMFNSGGANPPGIWDAIREVLRPAEMRMGYGMTETSASATSSVPEDDDTRLLDTHGRFKPASVAGDPALGRRVALYKARRPSPICRRTPAANWWSRDRSSRAATTRSPRKPRRPSPPMAGCAPVTWAGSARMSM
jgi:fatty-acyl-CoA synthase